MNELTHQPFNDWMLAGEPLSVDQTQELQDHLRTCETCRQRQQAWNGVQHLFHSSGNVGPAPGFAFRWQVRMVAFRLERQRRIAWVFFVIMASLALLLLGLMAWQLMSALPGPQQLLAAGMLALARFGGLVKLANQVLANLRSFVSPFSFAGLVFFTGFVSLISVLWLVAFQQLRQRGAEV